MSLKVQYSIRDGHGRLLVFAERDLSNLLVQHIKPKGIGLLKTERNDVVLRGVTRELLTPETVDE